MIQRCENKSLAITTTTQNPVTISGDKELNGNEAGFVIGAVFGALFLIVVILIVIAVILRRYRKRNKYGNQFIFIGVELQCYLELFHVYRHKFETVKF